MKDLPDGEQYTIENGGGIRSVEIHVTESISSLKSPDLWLSEIEFYVQR